MNWYPHHIGDFDKATRHLTRLERSIYRDLLDLYYDTEKPLPIDTAWICRRIIASSNEESTAVEQVLNEFFIKTPDSWFHVRCDSEIVDFKNNQSQKSAAGKASAAAKQLRKQQALNGCLTVVEQTNNGDSTNQQPTTNNQKPVSKNKEPKENTPPDGFNDFWRLFPDKRKGSKGKCLEYWIKHNLDKQKETIYAHMTKMGDDWLKDGGQFAPAPMTYLNQKRWDGFEQTESGLGVSYT